MVALAPSRSTGRWWSIATEPASAGLATIVPAVLAGGRSERFGRDKLLADVDGRPMVAAPIAALREVFGPRVVVVGPCDPAVRALGDSWLADDHPGTGPMGAIATVLDRLGQPTMVLAGDLPAMDAAAVRRLADAFLADPAAAVVLATSGKHPDLREHPCAALYGLPMLATLESGLRRSRFSLREAIGTLPASAVVRVPLPERTLANINDPAELARHLAAQGPWRLRPPLQAS
jgi:molybdopterin-guanine dinucleotide biosynthesis protein A